MDKKVNLQMNLMSAIAIIMVVCGHEACGALTLSNLFPYYSFHLPVFVFISGYFYSAKSENNIFAYVLSKAKNLLSYFFFWEFTYAALIAVLNHLMGNKFSLLPRFSFESIFISPILNGSYGLTSANWYLIMLFFLLTANIFLRKALSFLYIKSEYVIFLFYLGLGCLGITMANNHLNTKVFLRITQVMFFLPILSLGLLYRNHLEKHINEISDSIYFSIVFLIQALIRITGGKFEATSAWMTGFGIGPIYIYIYMQ